jgi:membrane protein DedA with SNARE-associated domain
MEALTDKILTLGPSVVYLVVGLLVFAEDALFFGFVLPGETAAVLGGVTASQGRVGIVAICAIVVAAAIVGDSVGYEVGRHAGTRLLEHRSLSKHRSRLAEAENFLRTRGGVAVFLGRFTAFFRAVMPALAGTARMPYRTFLPYNAVGGVVWGVGFVLLGYLAGTSFHAVEATVGRGLAVVVTAVVAVALVVWLVRRRRLEARPPG